MGEVQNNLFEPTFNRSVKVQSTDLRITSDAGVLLLREAESRLGIIQAIVPRNQPPMPPRPQQRTVLQPPRIPQRSQKGRPLRSCGIQRPAIPLVHSFDKQSKHSEIRLGSSF